MKTVIVIWATAGIVAIGSMAYMNWSVNALVAQGKAQLQAQSSQVQPSTGVANGSVVCIQNCQPLNLQSAINSGGLTY